MSATTSTSTPPTSTTSTAAGTDGPAAAGPVARIAAALVRTGHRGLASPVEVVWRRGPAEVVRFRRPADAPPARGAPVLLVPSIINRSYVLDLGDGQSFARALVERGLEVFLVDWGEPRACNAHLDLAGYALGLLPAAIAAARAAAGGAPAVHLAGYCLGGTFALLAAARGAPGIGRVLALATPVDLGDPGAMGALTDARLLDAERLARAFPVVPGALLWAAFQALDPVGIARKWRGFAARAGESGFAGRFLAQERWVADPVDVTGRALRDVVVRLYRENALARGALTLGGRAVRLEDGRAPVLNVIARGDTIVPPAQARPLAGLWGGPVETVELAGGHIGVTTGSRAAEGLWEVAARWLGEGERPAAGAAAYAGRS